MSYPLIYLLEVLGKLSKASSAPNGNKPCGGDTIIQGLSVGISHFHAAL